MLARAVHFSDKTSQRERLIILSKDASRRGRLRDYRRICEEIIRKYPSDTEIYSSLGLFHLRRREFDISIKYYKKYVKLSHYSIGALSSLIEGFGLLGGRDSVLVYLSKFEQLFPEAPMLPILQTYYHYLPIGDFDNAINSAKQAVALKPEEFWSHRTLGIAYLFAGKLDSALTAFQKSDYEIDIIRKVPTVLAYQGKQNQLQKFLSEKQRSEDVKTRNEAREKATIFYELNNESEKARALGIASREDIVNMELSQRNKGDTFVADSLLKLAIPEAHFDGNTEEALRLCELLKKEVASKDLGGGYLLDLNRIRARILYNAKRYGEAAKVYKILLNEYPKIVYRYRLADCYYRAKEYKKAKAKLLKVKSFLEPEPWWLRIDFGYAFPRTFYLLGLVNQALGELSEAKEAYKTFLAIWKEADAALPELVDAKRRLARLSSDAGK